MSATADKVLLDTLGILDTAGIRVGMQQGEVEAIRKLTKSFIMAFEKAKQSPVGLIEGYSVIAAFMADGLTLEYPVKKMNSVKLPKLGRIFFCTKPLPPDPFKDSRALCEKFISKWGE